MFNWYGNYRGDSVEKPTEYFPEHLAFCDDSQSGDRKNPSVLTSIRFRNTDEICSDDEVTEEDR